MGYKFVLDRETFKTAALAMICVFLAFLTGRFGGDDWIIVLALIGFCAGAICGSIKSVEEKRK